MTPFILDGDRLLVDPGWQLRRGDVVFACTGEGECLAHRVIRRYRGNRVKLQGDRNWRPDGVYPPSKLLGSVVAIERDGAEIRLDRGLYRWLGLVWSYLQLMRRIAWPVARVLLGSSREY